MKNQFVVGISNGGMWQCPLCGSHSIRQFWYGDGTEYVYLGDDGVDPVECDIDNINDREYYACAGCAAAFCDLDCNTLYYDHELQDWYDRNCK